jgi:acetyl esterase/lipase
MSVAACTPGTPLGRCCAAQCAGTRAHHACKSLTIDYKLGLKIGLKNRMTTRLHTSRFATWLALCLSVHAAQAGPLRDWLAERRQHAADMAASVSAPTPDASDDDESATDNPVDAKAFGTPVRLLKDIAYGPDAHQRLDVYAPPNASHAPVIFMVHGGAWSIGDKAHGKVVHNKVKHWLPRGFVFVSVDYRLVPQVTPAQQVQDLAQALATAQKQATQWGADPNRFVLMGHSAGAHLVALLNADPALALQAGAHPWPGTVLLDSAAMDLVKIMRSPRHYRFYDKAFGKDPAAWPEVSPLQRLTAQAAPFLAICSSKRQDSCPQAQALVDKAAALHVPASVLPQPLSHGDINGQLGIESGPQAAYTQAVDDFIGSLPAFKRDARP